MITARLAKSVLIASISITLYLLGDSQEGILKARYREREIEDDIMTSTTDCTSSLSPRSFKHQLPDDAVRANPEDKAGDGEDDDDNKNDTKVASTQSEDSTFDIRL